MQEDLDALAVGLRRRRTLEGVWARSARVPRRGGAVVRRCRRRSDASCGEPGLRFCRELSQSSECEDLICIHTTRTARDCYWSSSSKTLVTPHFRITLRPPSVGWENAVSTGLKLRPYTVYPAAVSSIATASPCPLKLGTVNTR